MEKEQLEQRKQITVKGVSRKAYFEFLEKIQEAVLEGYVIPPEGKRWAKDTPTLVGRQLTVFMYPKDYEIPAPGSDPEGKKKTQAEYLEAARAEEARNKALSEKSSEITEALEALTKKDELLAYAVELGIDVPEDKKAPKAIKAFIAQSVK